MAQRIGELTQRSGVSTYRLAQIAQEDFGLPWFSTTLDRLEAGSKDLTAVELLLLPAILKRAGVEFSLRDLFDREIVLTDQITASPEDIAGLFAGRVPKSWTTAPASFRDAGVRFRLRAAPAKDKPFADAEVKTAIEEASEAVATLGSHPRDVYRELEQRTARELGVPVAKVVETARRLWGESLSPIRDLTAEALVCREYGVRMSGESPEATAALPVARRRASAVLKQQIRAALSRTKPQRRG